MGGPVGSRWWVGDESEEHNASNVNGLDHSKDVQEGDGSRVVELSADASNPTAERSDYTSTTNGKLKKTGSGFFKGLRRKESSGSIADEHVDVNTQAAVDDGVLSPVSRGVSEDGLTEKQKGLSSILHGLGRKKKSSGNLTELTEAADSQAVDVPAAADSHDDDVPKKAVGGLLGRVKRAKSLAKSRREAAAEDQDGSIAAGEEDADTNGHQQDQDVAAGSAYDSSAGFEATAAEDAISAHHVVGASEITEATEASEVTDTGVYGGSEQSGEDGTATEDQQQYDEQQQEEEYVQDAAEQQGTDQNKAKGVFGLLARARSGSLGQILGKPKTEEELQAEREAAEAAAAAEAEARAAAEAAAAYAALTREPEKEPPIRKFPRGFMWGTATSAYQIEGAYQDEGKGLSIWDAFCHTPGKISGNANADISTCHFYRYKEDVALMRTMGVKYYRMSISWTRIFPNGKGKVNERGVAFYNRLINELIANRIMPVVTLYHWDLPLSLQIEEDGWLNPKIVDHFIKYAKTCFSRFGDRVKYWITINEPWCAAVLGHDSGGQHAPGRTVDPAREVYKVAHHMLIAHGRTYQMYQRLFKRKQRGKIGLALNGDWYEPKPAADLGEQRKNEKAAERALEFTLGWFARPVYQGDYPTLMRERCGNRLPRFTAEQRAMLKGSVDFFGLNHYSSHLCEQPAWYKELAPQQDEDEREGKLMRLGAQLERIMTTVTGSKPHGHNEAEIQEGDVAEEPAKVEIIEDDEEIPEDPYIESTGYWQDISVDQSDDDVWKTTDMGWGVYPEGMRKMLNYIQREYNPKGGIIITENGCAVAEEDEEESLKDIERAVYLKRYLTEVHKAILHDDVDVRGYFVWSLLDNFEWGYGYQKKFGLCYVDMQTLERIPKMSSNFYTEVIKKNRLEMI
eukprot:GHUV01000438.1.p1 GENE.GHUV01000438.1~~GHUV01000438.1.p1  ORF type:complete len:909 (+),score=324.27 GHUV01000438.1:86-2812(+)